MQILLSPVAIVHNTRTEAIDDFWGSIISEITLLEHIPTEAFNHICDFSHLEILFYFEKVNEEEIVFHGHPRGNKNYPDAGIFTQRKKDRPNKIGLCTVELIEHRNRSIFVKYLDAINGTPVLDIKPVIKQFQPQTEITQPAWVDDLMKQYW